MTWIYKMVQVDQHIEIEPEEGDDDDAQAAAYLSAIVNRYAKKGWEFYRIDSIGVVQNPGCFGVLLGQKHKESTYNGITFRKPREEKPEVAEEA